MTGMHSLMVSVYVRSMWGYRAGDHVQRSYNHPSLDYQGETGRKNSLWVSYSTTTSPIQFQTKGNSKLSFLFFILFSVIFSLYVQDDSTAIRKEDLVKFTEEVEGVVIPDVVLNRLFQFVRYYYSHIVRNYIGDEIIRILNEYLE